MKTKVLFFASLLACVFSLNLAAQNSREYIRNEITYQGNCRNVAITKTGGDLMLYGTNGWAGMGLPTDLTDALSELNNDNEYIDDVQLTENGKWLILYGNCGFRWNNIPYSLEKKLREWNANNEVVTCAAFNDYGEWIAISQNYYSASSDSLMSWLEDGAQKYGVLWTAAVTNDGVVAVFEEGFISKGNVPDSLWDKLRETSINVYRLKIAGTSWFIADKSGNYDYYM